MSTRIALVTLHVAILSNAFTYQPRYARSITIKRHVNTLSEHSQLTLRSYEVITTTSIMIPKMTQNEEEEVLDEGNKATSPTKLESFFDAILEIPDTRLFAGDTLFLLIVNFLLQIADEIGDPNFWLSGGFSQPITMPTTLLALIVRDSKMTISWILGGLWNRAYSSGSVSDDKTAIKKAIDIWVDYFSIRIIIELTGSILITHTPVDLLPLGREVWYTAIVMSFFRLAYGRFLSNFF